MDFGARVQVILVKVQQKWTFYKPASFVIVQRSVGDNR